MTIRTAAAYSVAMSEIDDALARLERAVTRLEAASLAGDAAATARLAAERVAEDRRIAEVAAAVVARVEAALDKIGQALEGEAPPTAPREGDG